MPLNLPVEFLLNCSEATAGEFQLNRLNEFANLKRKARELQEQAIEKAIEAGVALFLRTHRKEIVARLSRSLELPSDAELRLWLRDHGEDLVRLCTAPEHNVKCSREPDSTG